MSRRDLPLLGVDRGRPLTGPETIHVDVTNGCNTDCVTCWDHSPLLTIGRAPAWKRQRLDPKVLAALLDDAASLGGLRAVIVSGMGEPFTHPAIDEMLHEVKRRGLHLTVITNLVAADPSRILALGVDQLLVGIHAASERAYQAFHPSFVRGEWDRLLASLDALRRAGRRFKHVQVICATNADELVDMVRLAHRVDAARVNFKLASLKAGTEAVRVSPAQRERLARELVPAAQSAARELGVETNLDVFARQLAAMEESGESTAPIAEVGCFVGYTYARVTVSGDVLYCCNTEIRVGNLAEAPFSALWSGERWNALRDRLRRGEYFAGCHQCGKLAENVKLRRQFARAFGEARAREVTGGSVTRDEPRPQRWLQLAKRQ